MTEYVQYQGHNYKIDCNYDEVHTGGNVTVHFGKKSMGLIPFILILVIATALIFGVVTLINIPDNQISNVNAITDTSEEELCFENEQVTSSFITGEELYDRFCDTGIVFPNSDMAYLTEEEIDAISSSPNRAELLRYAINELYARHQFAFGIEPYKTHYLSLGYQAEKTMQQACDEFNAFEKANLNVLVRLEKT